MGQLAAGAAAFATGPVGIGLMIAGTAISAISMMQQASAAEDAGRAQEQAMQIQADNARKVAERNALIRSDEAKFAAARQREQAVQEDAAAIKRAKEVRRQTNIRVSSARAAGAAGGGAVSDPTVLDIIGDIVETGELGAQSEMFEGKSRSSLLRSQAALTEYQGERDAELIKYQGATDSNYLTYQGSVGRYEGDVKASALRTKAATTAMEGASSIAGKYAPKGEAISWNSGRFDPGVNYGPNRSYSVNSNSWFAG